MSWDRVRGHVEIRRRFAAAIEKGRLGQAYLFVGPVGVGKHLFARELARALLCEAPAAPLTPCGHCPACHLCDAGTHPDLLTASKPEDKQELPVDTVRALSAQMSLKPTRGVRKIAILQDADDFNDESANAFLKTLEEPPPGSLLILLATATEAQLPTILSRCQVLRFLPLADEDVAAVLTANGVDDPKKVQQLVRLAGGSPGRATALADDAVWAFRSRLYEVATAAKPDPQALGESWQRFVDDAGKEPAAQRARASVAVGLVLELVTAAARLSVGADPGGDPAEAAKLRPLAEKLGADKLADLLESCLEADYHIDRRVQLALVADRVNELLTRPA